MRNDQWCQQSDKQADGRHGFSWHFFFCFCPFKTIPHTNIFLLYLHLRYMSKTKILFLPMLSRHHNPFSLLSCDVIEQKKNIWNSTGFIYTQMPEPSLRQVPLSFVEKCLHWVITYVEHNAAAQSTEGYHIHCMVTITFTETTVK